MVVWVGYIENINGRAIVASHLTSTNFASVLSLPHDFPSSSGAPDEPPDSGESVVIWIP